MSKYHKIDTMFKRDMDNGGKIIYDQWAVPEVEYLKNNQWEFTEKVDGTNIRVYWDGNAVRFGGRTDNAQIPVPLLTRLDELFRTKPAMDRLGEVFPDARSIHPNDSSVVLYGEGYGAKVQGGGKYSSTPEFVLFDVRVGDWWLQRTDVEDVAAKLWLGTYGVVPVVGHGTLYDAIDLVKGGLTSAWGDFEAEGIVARPTTELFTRRGDRIIAKIKAKDFR